MKGRVHLQDRGPGVAFCQPLEPGRTRVTRDPRRVTCQNCRRRRARLDAFLARTRAR